MQVRAAAIQMRSEPGDVSGNLDRALSHLSRCRDDGVELAVLPEMFNTGYCARGRYGPLAEDGSGPTIRALRHFSRRWGMAVAAGFVEHHAGHLYDSLAVLLPDGRLDVYRKRHLVFWECTRFRRGRDPLVVSTPWGRIGLAICADMIYRRVWRDYRGRIDLAIVSAAWPDFADRRSGRPHWLFGNLGPLSGEIPRLVSRDLGIPVVFANMCGETETTIPMMPRIVDRFAGRSSLCDGARGLPVRAGSEEAVVIASLSVPSSSPDRGASPCRSTSLSEPAGWSSTSAA
ncbi:carbon-nitrogen hydrolase family protein [Tautonia sociabilis]|uniref:carbon-nitrogen hydrolase family protein n=1 Tax=Tautonia sociabilis TaxID=2080755 RepID=UPI0013152B9E|nr:carbon-nitrogen hydrolase family protein [Tautonia sociabilis]